MIAEDVGIIALGGGDALPLLQLLDRRNQVAIAGGAFILLRHGGLLHALLQRARQIRGTPFQEQLHVANRFLISFRRGQILHARTQATFDVVLKARPRMKAGQVDFA